MEKTIPVFSLKNIPIPSKFDYEKQLIQKGESLVSRFRWKLFVSKNPDLFTREYETFGFNTLNSPPRDKDLDNFEEKFFDLISPRNLKYKPVNNTFQNDLKQEINNIKSSDKIKVFADKTKNIYHVPVNDYKKRVLDTVTQEYEKCAPSKIKNVNAEAAELADNFPVGDDKTLADRIDVLQKNECFITFKDHKDSFPGRVETRLINPSKSNIGKISKQILQRINNKMRVKTGLQQWQSTNQAVEWFKGIVNKSKYTFFKLDIVSFYPSISEELLDKSISFAKTLVPITNEEIKIIKHSRKSFLFHNNESWMKKGGKEHDVTQGSNDGAEISELVGLFLLNGLKRYIKKDDSGLYRDDFISVVALSGPQVERLRKNLFNFFGQYKLKITIEANIKATDFLDISMNLETGIHRPFRKEDSVPTYINVNSNHPPHIKQNLPIMISKRISKLSSNEEVFNEEANLYNEGLRQAGYIEKIHYIQDDQPNNQSSSKTRKRKIIYFCPPWNDALASNLGRRFLELVDQCFKDTPLAKLFNRNTVKVSYSCTKNMKSIITGNNMKLLRPRPNGNHSVPEGNERECNCRSGYPCPVDGKCLRSGLVYSCKVDSNIGPRSYIGVTKNTFKERWNAHNYYHRHIEERNRTTLANYIWSLKERSIPFTESWSIEAYGHSYSPEIGYCNACTIEKYLIMKHFKERKLVNSRKEICYKCKHREGFLLVNNRPV